LVSVEGAADASIPLLTRIRSVEVSLPALGAGTFLNLLFLGWLARGEVSVNAARVWILGAALCALARGLCVYLDDHHGDSPAVLTTSALLGLWFTVYWLVYAPVDDPVAIGIAMIAIVLWWTSNGIDLAADPFSFTLLTVMLTAGPLLAAATRGTAFGGSAWFTLLLTAAMVATYVERRHAFLQDESSDDELLGLTSEVQLAFESARDGVLVTRSDRVTRSNTAARGLLRRDASDLDGRFLGEIFGPDQAIHPGAPVRIALTRRDGSGRLVEIAGRAHPELELTVWMLRDVTDEVSRVEKLRSMIESDELTGVANRRGMFDLLAGALGLQRPVAVLVVDVDNFKTINDRYGHAVGDRVLRGTVDRRVAAVGSDGIVTRIGGDEFVVVLTQPHAVEHRREIAGRIVEASRAPLVVTSEPLVVTISIGIGHTDGTVPVTPEDLLEDADRAMYRVKQDGRAGWRDASEDASIPG
jgi:diguanylate cyclase (GGDEF)-like protein